MAGGLVRGERHRQPVHGHHRGGTVGAAEAEQLRRPLVDPEHRPGTAVVAAQHRVEVRAAEAEGADAGVALAGGRGPRAALLIEEEGAGRGVPAGVRDIDWPRRGSHAGVQGVGGFDESGDPGRALRMADLGLDGPQPAAPRLGAGLREDIAEDREFGAVAHDGPRAVRLHQPDGRR